jgi:hypothetical protein
MKRFVPFLAASALALCAAAAFAQTSDPKSATPAPSSTAQAPATSSTPAPDASATPAPAASATTPAPASAAPATNPAIERVKEKSAKASAKERADVEKKLDEVEKQIETDAAKGEPDVAARLAAEFGVTADALTAEKSQYSRGWGELVVAHTLMSNAKTDATIADLFTMRAQGMGWGAIAAGLDLKLGDVVSAVKSEQKVASGLEKGDGKAATIHALADTGSAKAEKAAKKGKASEASTGTGTGMDMDKATGK